MKDSKSFLLGECVRHGKFEEHGVELTSYHTGELGGRYNVRFQVTNVYFVLSYMGIFCMQQVTLEC